MTQEIYNNTFELIKETYNVKKVTAGHCISIMYTMPAGSVSRAQCGMTAIAFLINLKDKLNIEKEIFAKILEKIIDDM